jgi:hypothetical protein
MFYLGIAIGFILGVVAVTAWAAWILTDLWKQGD